MISLCRVCLRRYLLYFFISMRSGVFFLLFWVVYCRVCRVCRVRGRVSERAFVRVCDMSRAVRSLPLSRSPAARDADAA